MVLFKLEKTCRICVGAFLLALAACAQREGAVGTHPDREADILLQGTIKQSPIAIGDNATFNVVVKNKGPKDAARVQIIDTVGKQSRLVSITCIAQQDATCPRELGTAMVVDLLPVHGSLEFHVTLQLSSGGTGTIVNSMSASVAEDPNPNDNVVTDDVMVR